MGSRPCSHIPTFAHWRNKIMTTETTTQVKPFFDLGRTLATPGSLSKLTKVGIKPVTLLNRHVKGDWQEMDAEDQESNREALTNRSRIFSAYSLNDIKFWVITEADRSSTTILLPEEY